MVDGQTVRVVTQAAYDVAFGNLSMPAVIDHPLELAFQCLKLFDLTRDFLELGLGDPIGRIAGLTWIIRQLEQIANSFQREA